MDNVQQPTASREKRNSIIFFWVFVAIAASASVLFAIKFIYG